MALFGVNFLVSRPHRFGLVFWGAAEAEPQVAKDYLHEVLLAEANREAFFDLIEKEGLVVCKNIQAEASSYRRVKGKSSAGRLSQAEYYHHDGCSGPAKPRIDEIRLPHTALDRSVATAVAPFEDVVRAQFEALPERLLADSSIVEGRVLFAEGGDRPPVELWDQIQGRTTRLVRRELDAESARAYFREVDRLAGAYDLPWEAGESRLMLNDHPDLTQTMQHRRAYQKPRVMNEANGSLVKRWTAEELA